MKKQPTLDGGNAEVPSLPHGCGSWMIVRKSDGHAVLETFSRKVASAVNGKLYAVVTAMDYLGKLNRNLKEA